LNDHNGGWSVREPKQPNEKPSGSHESGRGGKKKDTRKRFGTCRQKPFRNQNGRSVVKKKRGKRKESILWG